MNFTYRNTIVFIIFFYSSFCISKELISINHDNEITSPAGELPEVADEEAIISFNYVNENLIDIVNYIGAKIASKRDINIIPPQGASAMKEKITYKAEGLLTLEQAWKLLITILDIADYIISEKENTYVILKKNNETLREPVPIYIGTSPEDIPETDSMIRYLYYFSNIKVSMDSEHEVNTILRSLLSINPLFQIDVSTNSVLIVDKATKVRDVMTIIMHLDKVTFQEKMEAIHLIHTDAIIVANLLNEELLKIPDQSSRYHLDARKQSEAFYFARGTKVIPVEDSNTLIIIGRTQAVDRIIDFIQESIDRPPESGKTILHVYRLKYLDAYEFAPTLTRIVESSKTGGTGQSRSGEKTLVQSGERFFDEVIIKTDTERWIKPALGEEPKYYGGNNLIVACRNEDAKQIEALIEKLDTPLPQVLLEILVADMTIDDTRSLGFLTRNPDKIPILNTMQFQTAQLKPGIILDQVPDPTTIASDLLAPVFDPTTGLQVPESSTTVSAAAFAPVGGTILSLSDNNGKTWSIGEILKLFSTSKVLSLPHVVATNNKPALVKSGQTRLLPDQTSESLGGAAVRKLEAIEADLTVNITPRISGNTVNLQVKVEIDDFIAGTNARTTREVVTNGNVKSGSVFVLGGFNSLSNNQSSNETPGLSSVPVLGWFFKNREGEFIKNNLTVFIAPTIIQPRLRRGVGEYTQDYIEVAKMYSDEGALFNMLKDPITHLFFKPTSEEMDVDNVIEDFIAKDELLFDSQRPATPTKKIMSDESSRDDTVHETARDLYEKDAYEKYSYEKVAFSPEIKKLLQETKNPFIAESQLNADAHTQYSNT